MGALVGKLKALYPDSNTKELVPVAKAAVEKVNGMGMDEIHADFERFEKEGFELKIPEKKVGLLDLEWTAHEPVVTRFAPNPSAPIHLGHARPAILCFLYSKKYAGKFILRFDDTDPKIKKPMEGGEQLFLDDLAWLGIVPDMVTRASDRMEIHYDYMHQLVEMGHAYVCTCDVEEWKLKKIAQEACPCRALSVEENKSRFARMLNHTYKQGEAVLRIKTDLNADDPAERDWSAARIVDNPQHYRVQDKYLWPTYNFASAIDDHLMGITLIIRGQQHTSNVKKQEWLYRHFGWNYPHSFHHGKISMMGAELSKSKMVEGVATGKYIGWDDPRLFTLRTLRRKGFKPEALIDIMIDFGVKTSDTMIDLEILGTFNKKYVENSPIVSFIENPIQLDADFVPQTNASSDGVNYSLKAGTQSFFVSKNETKNWKVGT
ncbi:MAG: glutamate--tRNA ligase family protein, partial [archaeon]